MSTIRLTDISTAQSTAITPTTLIHIVTTADTTQFSGGSSYKAQLGQLSSAFSFEKEVMYQVINNDFQTDFNSKVGLYLGDGGAEQNIYCSGIIPNDFNSLISCDLVLIPRLTIPFNGISFELNYGQNAQQFSANTTTDTLTPSFIRGEITFISLDTLFASVTSNDVFNLLIDVGGYALYMVGVRLIYNT